MKKLLIIFSILISLLPLSAAFGDNIRGKVVKNVLLTDSSKPDDNSFTMSIEDVFAVSFDRNSEFIRGFEVEIRVPSALRNYSSSFAFNIYKQISPEVSSGIGTYYGRKYHSLMIPEAARFYIQLPYTERLQSETAPYTTVLTDVVNFNDSPLMFTVLPMMKGFPSSLYNNNFSIKVYPILKESGNLNVNISIPEGLDKTSLDLSIDGKKIKIDGTSASVPLAAGSHSINADIAGGKNINRSFTVKAGETTELKLSVEKLESFVTIDVPENTVVYMDGKKVEFSQDGRFSVAPGEHMVLFKIGDYKISKKFDIYPGKDCKISLFLDIFIEEN